MAKRKSTLDAFAPVRVPAPEEQPRQEEQAAEERPSQISSAAEEHPAPSAPAGRELPAPAPGASAPTAEPPARADFPGLPAPAPAADHVPPGSSSRRRTSPSRSLRPDRAPAGQPQAVGTPEPPSTRPMGADASGSQPQEDGGEEPAPAGTLPAATQQAAPTPIAQPRPGGQPRLPLGRPPRRRRAALSAGDEHLVEILENVAQLVPAGESDLRRLTLYLPPGTYERLQAVWAGIRERTGLKVSRAALVLAALETVLASPDLTERMILDTVQAKLARSALSEQM